MYRFLPDPNLLTVDELLSWVESKVRYLHQAVYDKNTIEGCYSEEWHNWQEEGVPIGEASASWRRFFVATLLADWACYDKSIDRADVPRLRSVLLSAYRFFRLWFCLFPDGERLPVGYSGWYPISSDLFERLKSNPSLITDRGAFKPLDVSTGEAVKYAYGFNVSIIKPLQNTLVSRRLLRAYCKDAFKLGDVGIAAITVGDAGSRFSELLKLRPSAKLVVEGDVEELFLRERRG